VTENHARAEGANSPTPPRWGGVAVPRSADGGGGVMTNDPDGVNAVEDANSYGLAATGKAGDFTVEVLNGSEGRWWLSIASPAWCFDFELANRTVVSELGVFLRRYTGRTEFADLVLGSFGGWSVRIIKCDEFEDRLFLCAGGDGSLVDFTLVGPATQDFATAVQQAAEELDTEA
jgi:hypothetical protein